MKKRTAILILVVVIALGSSILYFLLGGKAPNGLPVIPGLPFGNPPEDTSGVPQDGSGDGSGTDNGADTSGTDNGIGQVDKKVFTQLSDTPHAGAVVFTKSGDSIVRFVERSNGHVWEVNLRTLEKKKILNTTRPQIYQSLWKTDGTGFVERTVAKGSDVVLNTSITLVPPTSTTSDALYTLKGTVLQGEVGDMKLLQNGSLLYVLLDNQSISTSGFAGEKPRTIMSSDFYSWLIHPTSNASAVVATKPSFVASGYAYNLNLTSGSLTKILGPLTGLTVLPSPDGSRILYGHNERSTPKLTALNNTTKTTLEILPTTLPEKCVWSRKVTSIIICGAPEQGLGQSVPDLWYQGEVSYSDKVWRFNIDTNTAEVLLDPKTEFETEVDATEPALSQDESYLIFTNKKDLSLWLLKLEE